MQFTAKIKKANRQIPDLQQTGQIITKHTHVNKQTNVGVYHIAVTANKAKKSHSCVTCIILPQLGLFKLPILKTTVASRGILF